MRMFGCFTTVAAALAITVPAHAEGLGYNGGDSLAASPDTGGAQAFASGVKLAYSYTRGGNDRSIGVLRFTNPSRGIYCLQPSSPLKLRKIYPLVSIEWDRSFGESLVAFWRDTSIGTDCPPGNLEVRTYDISRSSSPILTANVAFDIVVN